MPTDKDDADDLAPFRQTLADLLATLRNEADLTQQQVADRLGYSRTTVAGAETAHRLPGKAFWTAADDVLAPSGELRSAHAQLVAARQDRDRRLARQAEVEREARVARWRDASNLPAIPATGTPTVTTVGPETGGDGGSAAGPAVDAFPGLTPQPDIAVGGGVHPAGMLGRQGEPVVPTRRGVLGLAGASVMGVGLQHVGTGLGADLPRVLEALRRRPVVRCTGRPAGHAAARGTGR